jgi:hypothetical protein
MKGLTRDERLILQEAARIRKRLNEGNTIFRNRRTGEQYRVSEDDYYDFKRDMQATGDWNDLEEETASKDYSYYAPRRASDKQVNFISVLRRKLGIEDDRSATKAMTSADANREISSLQRMLPR